MESNVLKIGDIVIWRSSWGKDAPKEAKVTAIEINCVNKSGKEVSKVSWDKVDSRKVIVNLENGHWAYGTQISKKIN